MNLKRFSIWSLAALSCLSLWAIPAKRGLRSLQQPDGSVVKLQIIGDEHFHTFATPDGLAAQRGSDGFFYLRSSEGISDIKVSSFKPSSLSDFSKFGVNNLIQQNARSAKARRAARKVNDHKSQVPSSGAPKIPVILVQYKDIKFKDSDPKTTFTGFFSKGENSAYQYFVDQSNGKYTPQFDVYGPFTLANNRSTYGGNQVDRWGNSEDKGVGKMVAEGCLGLDSSINFADYDNDGDGECDVVIVLYAGDGEASSYDENAEDAVWPCQWELSESDYGKSLRLDGTKVEKFAVFNELYGSDLSKIDGIGTFCHEFSHCLDLPDFYDTQYGPHFGMGHWSLMDYGSYNNDGYTPIGYSAYEKEFMGWIDIDEATENTKYTLQVFNQKNILSDKAVKVTNSKDKNEYYILENRAKQGWDKYMPAEGLFIYHVTYDRQVWLNNTVNDEDLQRMTPIPADNSLKLDKEKYYGETYYNINEADLKGDLWPYNGNNELTDTSTPAAKVNTGSFMNKPITEITKNSDGTISFWTMKAPLPALDTPTSVSHTVTSENSVVISWSPLSEEVTYTLEYGPHYDITYSHVSSTNFTSDNNWASEPYTVVEPIEDGIRLGSNKQLGSITSPAFSTGDQNTVTVIFNAKYYSNDQSSLKVSAINASGAVIDSETFSLTSSYKDYIALLEVPDNSMVSIRIEVIATKKRAYINSADIYTGDASELTSSRQAAREPATVISGITSNSYTISNLIPGIDYDYRIKAVPVDDSKFSDSPWSEKFTFNISPSSVNTIFELNGDVEVYNLQGVRLNSLPSQKGIYIVRSNGKSSKVLVK